MISMIILTKVLKTTIIMKIKRRLSLIDIENVE